MRYKLYSGFLRHTDAGPKLFAYINNIKKKRNVLGIHVIDGVFAISHMSRGGRIAPTDLKVYVPESHPLFNFNLTFEVYRTSKVPAPDFRKYEIKIRQVVDPLFNKLLEITKNGTESIGR